MSDEGPVTLACSSPDDPDERHVLTRVGSGPLHLLGLLADTPYDCLVPGERRAAWVGSFRTGPLPDGLPRFDVGGDAATAVLDDGYVLFNHWRFGPEDRQFRAIVADGLGNIRWYLDLPEAISGGIAVTWTGDELVVGGGGIRPSLRDLAGEIRFEVAPPAFEDPEEDVYNHEAALTPAGVLSLQLVPDTDGVVTWEGFRVEVTDPADGAVVWRFDSRTAREAGGLPPGTEEDDDPYHANAAQWRDDDPDGPSVWVSLRALQQILRIDRATGATSFVGHAGDRALFSTSGEPLPATEWFYGQHAPYASGRDLLVYDNGSFRQPRFSRVAAYHLESEQRATLEWSWTEGGWFEPNWGSAAPMGDGHVLVATGHCAYCSGTGGERGRGWMLELDPAAGAPVWRLDFTESTDTLYRAQWVDGCSLFANQRFCEAR